MGSILSEQEGRMTKTHISSKLILINVSPWQTPEPRNCHTGGRGRTSCDRTSAFLPWDPPAREQVGGVLALKGGYGGMGVLGAAPGGREPTSNPNPRPSPVWKVTGSPKPEGTELS